MFDFALPAIIAGSIGILYLWLLAPRMIPKRELPIADGSPRVFVAHLAIMEGSPALGGTLAQALEKTDGAMNIMSVERGPDNFVLPKPGVILRSGDYRNPYRYFNRCPNGRASRTIRAGGSVRCQHELCHSHGV